MSRPIRGRMPSSRNGSRDPLVVSRVIGDVLDPFVPSTTLQVTFNGRAISNAVELRTQALARQPSVEIGGEDMRTLYSLVMVDPDAPNPSEPTSREYLHWMVVNIPGSTNATFGEEIVNYEAPRPVMGIHRIVLALIPQPCRLTVQTPGWREQFNTRDFIEYHDLRPTAAAIFFNCQRDTGSGGRR